MELQINVSALSETKFFGGIGNPHSVGEAKSVSGTLSMWVSHFTFGTELAHLVSFSFYLASITGCGDNRIEDPRGLHYLRKPLEAGSYFQAELLFNLLEDRKNCAHNQVFLRMK